MMIDTVPTVEISDWTKLAPSPVVSVYTLAYQHEKFIAQAIEGVIAQKCDFPIELIIGEDCSPDRTRDIVLDYQCRYPSLIRALTADRNVGAIANGRRCQLATRGKYIAICEGDDFWHHPRKLQMQVELMDANPGMPICHTDYDRLTRWHHRHNCHRRNLSPWLAMGDAYVALLHDWSVKTATSMYRRDVFTAFIGSIYDNFDWPFSDLNKLLFASLRGPFGYLDVSTATYRKTRSSASNSGRSASLKMSLAQRECLEIFMNQYPVDIKTRKDVLNRIDRKIYDRSFRAENMTEFMHSYERLVSNDARPNPFRHFILSNTLKSGVPIRLLNKTRDIIDRNLSAI